MAEKKPKTKTLRKLWEEYNEPISDGDFTYELDTGLLIDGFTWSTVQEKFADAFKKCAAVKRGKEADIASVTAVQARLKLEDIRVVICAARWVGKVPIEAGVLDFRGVANKERLLGLLRELQPWTKVSAKWDAAATVKEWEADMYLDFVKARGTALEKVVSPHDEALLKDWTLSNTKAAKIQAEYARAESMLAVGLPTPDQQKEFLQSCVKLHATGLGRSHRDPTLVYLTLSLGDKLKANNNKSILGRLWYLARQQQGVTVDLLCNLGKWANGQGWNKRVECWAAERRTLVLDFRIDKGDEEEQDVSKLRVAIEVDARVTLRSGNGGVVFVRADLEGLALRDIPGCLRTVCWGKIEV